MRSVARDGRARGSEVGAVTQDAGLVRDARAGERAVVVVRDKFGAPFAVEVVDAAAWREEFAEPPAPERADVRIVRLRRGRAPAVLPSWLHVETRSARVAEVAPAYEVAEATGRVGGDDVAIAERLWRASTRYREPGPPLAEFLAAGAVAATYPQAAPTGTVRRRAAVDAFVAGCGGVLGVVATVEGDACERWLRYAFGVPDRFAEAVLLARLDDAGAVEMTSALRFLRDAEVDVGGASEGVLAELMWDRRALLEQASPWRYFEQVGPGHAGTGPFASAVAAMRAWRVRYRIAYAAHYAGVQRAAGEARRALDAASGAADALRRLDALRALGAPIGVGPLAAFVTARAGLASLPLEPAADAARTAEVTLGSPLPLVAQAREAIQAVRAALEQQRARLASRAAHLVLAREEVPALDRLLQVIVASDLGGLERVLDARLAEHIEALLAAPVGR